MKTIVSFLLAAGIVFSSGMGLARKAEPQKSVHKNEAKIIKIIKIIKQRTTEQSSLSGSLGDLLVDYTFSRTAQANRNSDQSTQPFADALFEDIVSGNSTIITQRFFPPEFISKLDGFDFHPQHFGQNSILVITQKPLGEVVQMFGSVPGTFQLCEVSKSTGNGGNLSAIIQAVCGGQGDTGQLSSGQSMSSGDPGFNVFTSECGGGGGGGGGSGGGSSAVAGSGMGECGSGEGGTSASSGLGGGGGSGGNSRGNAFGCGQKDGHMQILGSAMSRQEQVSQGGAILTGAARREEGMKGLGMAGSSARLSSGWTTVTKNGQTNIGVLEQVEREGIGIRANDSVTSIVMGSNGEPWLPASPDQNAAFGGTARYLLQRGANGQWEYTGVMVVTGPDGQEQTYMLSGDKYEPVPSTTPAPATTPPATTPPATTPPATTPPATTPPATTPVTPQPIPGQNPGEKAVCDVPGCDEIKQHISQMGLNRNEELAAKQKLQMMMGGGVTNPGEMGAGRFGFGGSMLSPCSGGGNRYLEGDGSGGRGAGYGRTDPSPVDGSSGTNAPDPCRGPLASGLAICQPGVSRDTGRRPDPRPDARSQGASQTPAAPAASGQRNAPAGSWQRKALQTPATKTKSPWKKP